jgi:hypothetical protein
MHASSPDDATASLLPLFDLTVEEVATVPSNYFDDSNTREGLTTSGITCPAVDGRLLDRYVEALIRCGFLKKP